MREKTIAVKGHGQADVGCLSIAEQRVFYDAIVARLIAFRKIPKEGVM